MNVEYVWMLHDDRRKIQHTVYDKSCLNIDKSMLELIAVWFNNRRQYHNDETIQKLKNRFEHVSYFDWVLNIVDWCDEKP